MRSVAAVQLIVGAATFPTACHQSGPRVVWVNVYLYIFTLIYNLYSYQYPLEI